MSSRLSDYDGVMSRKGLAAAHAHGTTLPRFRSAAEARRALHGVRDRSLAELRLLAKDSTFELDATPDSLLVLERWYFALVARRGFSRLGIDRARFEIAMGFYFGAVAVKHAKARWIVEPFAFTPGTYEIGIAKGNFSLMGIDALCERWHARPGNKTHRALSREYAQHFTPAPKRVSKPKPADVAIEAAVSKILGLKSCLGRHPWELANDVRDALGNTKTTLPTSDVDRVLATMVKRKRLIRVELGGTGRYSVTYVLPGRSYRIGGKTKLATA